MKLSFIEHIKEAKDRLIACIVAFIGLCLIHYIYYPELIFYFIKPLYTYQIITKQQLIAINNYEIFHSILKIIALLSLYYTVPYIILQG